VTILFVVTEAEDPERLLADALRAQARSTPAAGPGPEPLVPRYGLLSGADPGSLEREHAALEPPIVSGPVARPEPPARRQLAAYWVLALAVLLGLLTGVVIDLFTVF